MRIGGGGHPAKDLGPNTKKNQYNFGKGNSTLEEVKIAAFAVLGQFGAEYEKIVLCGICVWCTWGKRTGLYDEFCSKRAKNLTHNPIKL